MVTRKDMIRMQTKFFRDTWKPVFTFYPNLIPDNRRSFKSWAIRRIGKALKELY